MTKNNGHRHLLLDYLLSKKKAGTLTEKERAVLEAIGRLLNSEYDEDFGILMSYVNECLQITIDSVENYKQQRQSAITIKTPRSRRERLKQELGYDRIHYGGMPLSHLIDLSDMEILDLFMHKVITVKQSSEIKRERVRLEAILKMPDDEPEGLVSKFVKFWAGE